MAIQNSSLSTLATSGRELYGLVAEAHALRSLYESMDVASPNQVSTYGVIANSLIERVASQLDEYLDQVMRVAKTLESKEAE